MDRAELAKALCFKVNNEIKQLSKSCKLKMVSYTMWKWIENSIKFGR